MNQVDKIKAQLVIVTGLLVLYFIFKSPYLLYAAAIIGVLCVFFEAVGDFIVKIWYKIAEGMGWVNSRVLLSVVFFVFLAPIAFFYRITSKDPLKIKKSDGKSVYTNRDHKYTAKDLDNIW